MIKRPPDYYAALREDLIAFVPEDARRVLEVGCGIGRTGKAIKEKRGGTIEVTGVEKEADVAAEARNNIDKVIVGDVESISLPFERPYFDCIIYGEVLEHLRDPWGALLKHREFLKTGGVVIASIPNIAHYRVVKMLRRKEWSYQSGGILDLSHLRFFTIKSIYDLFRRSRLDIIHVGNKISASKIRKALNKVLRGALLHDITEQYIVVARKSS